MSPIRLTTSVWPTNCTSGWKTKTPSKSCNAHWWSKYKGIQSELDAIDKDAAAQVDEATQYGLDSPIPTYEDLINNVYVTSSENEKVES